MAPWLPTTATRIVHDGETVARTAGVGIGLGGSSVESKPVAGGAVGTDVTSTVQHWLACDGALTLADIERETIVATLKRNRGHRQRSAKALGIGVRTLGLKLKKWKEDQVVEQDL